MKKQDKINNILDTLKEYNVLDVNNKDGEFSVSGDKPRYVMNVTEDGKLFYGDKIYGGNNIITIEKFYNEELGGVDFKPTNFDEPPYNIIDISYMDNGYIKIVVEKSRLQWQYNKEEKK